MRRAGVDDLGSLGAEPIGKRHRLPGGIVGQAQHDQIGPAHQLAARALVLALVRRDACDLEAGDAGEPAADFEARGAGLPVDEHDGQLGPGGGLGFGFRLRSHGARVFPANR